MAEVDGDAALLSIRPGNPDECLTDVESVTL